VGAEELLIFDEDGDSAGAPQSVQVIAEVISTFPGEVIVDAGIHLIHVADLVLGLGASRVAVSVAAVSTDLALNNFATRFGSSVVFRGSAAELGSLSDAGVAVIVQNANPRDVRSVLAKELLVDPDDASRNPGLWADVSIAGLVVRENEYPEMS
jgi:imidazole glycerol phosphate synthase subunit HisF